MNENDLKTLLVDLYCFETVKDTCGRGLGVQKFEHLIPFEIRST